MSQRTLLVATMLCLWLGGCSGSSEKVGPSTSQSQGKRDGGSCVVATCATLNAECGKTADGCGGVLECGSCKNDEFCGGSGPNRCGKVPCVPKSCAEQGAECGEVSDNCSNMISCGNCASPQTCAGAGIQNKCGCTPTTCAAIGAACGEYDNGCKGKLQCGSCTEPATCGGGGIQGQCGSPCDPIAAHAGWLVCKGGAGKCNGMYQDGAGCKAYCAAAGMVCKERFGAHGTCEKEPEYPIPCDEKNDHDSDWCECGY